ncbi:MAG: squalene--hopene cyclase, partial [Actinomycetota bacterium]|nr:squalene--hopene cyclase [Actinomycetota bacterium]
MSVAVGSSLDRALDAGVERLIELQRPGGWWVGELESNVTMTAQHLFLLHFLRRLDGDTLRRCANELLARQRPDGTWAIYWGGDPDLAATLEAYAALRLAGLDADDSRLAGARRFCEERGGIGASRVFTRMWLSLLGVWQWEEIPQIPPELVFLHPSMPFSLYDFACWARQTVVPLAVVMHYRPVRPLARERAIHELNLGITRPPTTVSDRLWWAGNRLASWYFGQPFKPGRERALRTMEQWILQRQELDGSWGGIQPPWVWSLIALACRGHGPDSPYVARGLRGWERFLVEDGDRLRPEACQSPVWDTGLALLALRAAGVECAIQARADGDAHGPQLPAASPPRVARDLA